MQRNDINGTRGQKSDTRNLAAGSKGLSGHSNGATRLLRDVVATIVADPAGSILITQGKLNEIDKQRCLSLQAHTLSKFIKCVFFFVYLQTFDIKIFKI